jgi:N-acetyl-anhydromuramyl-L-alanine amidase AmpD
MPSLLIQPTRTEVTRSFPVLGFTIRTGESPSWFEVAIAADPSLFEPSARARRTASNFYSSRVAGPLPAQHGEAVYLVPQAVVDRFAAHDRIYYALAAYSEPAFRSPHVVTPPKEAAPFIFISKSYSGVGRRLSVRPARRGGVADRDGGYVDERPESLEWGGDEAMPGKAEPVAPAPAKPTAGTATAPGAPAAHAAELGYEDSYDDGFDRALWVQQMEAVADDDQGIDGPLPDSTDAPVGAMAITAPEYPGARRYVPANPANYRAVTGTRTINRIVIHITDGGRNIDGTVSWFKNPAARVSAHYVVGQDGEVVQMVANNDVAWHAHHANGDSIGIEHVANKARGILPTEDEYRASAALVCWLCNQFNLPADRDHILGHSEADPKTTHTGCPNSVWDWSHYMDLVQNACTPATPTDGEGTAVATQSLGTVVAFEGGQSFDINWGDITLRNQTSPNNCWATAAAMVAGWATNNPNYPIKDTPVPPNVEEAATRYDLELEPPMSISIDAFKNLLETTGPQWVSADQQFEAKPGFHAVVVAGMYSDGAPDGSDTYLKILDPWDRAPGTPGHPGAHTGTHNTGSTYIMAWPDFLTEFEGAARHKLWVRLMHAHDTGGRQPGMGASALSLAMAAAAAHEQEHHRRQRMHPRKGLARTMGPEAAVAGAIAGIVINRIEDKQGAVSWHLDQWSGPKRPWDKEAFEGPTVWGHHVTKVEGPWVEMISTTRLGADFEIEWDSNGRSIRNIVISCIGTDDFVWASLDVQGRIVDEPNAYNFPGDTTPVAAVHVRFDYHFHLHLQPDEFCITNVTLYGNGKTGFAYDWWK